MPPLTRRVAEALSYSNLIAMGVRSHYIAHGGAILATRPGGPEMARADSSRPTVLGIQYIPTYSKCE